MSPEQPLTPTLDQHDPVPAMARSITIELPDQGDATINAKMAMVLALYMLDLPHKEIARRVGLAPATVRNYVCHGRRLGALKGIDPAALVRNRLVDKAVDTIDELMDEGHDDELRAKLATDALRGSGGYQQYQKQDVRGLPGTPGGGASVDFTLNLVITEPKREIKASDAIMGEIVGVPRTLETAEQKNE